MVEGERRGTDQHRPLAPEEDLPGATRGAMEDEVAGGELGGPLLGGVVSSGMVGYDGLVSSGLVGVNMVW